MPFSTMWACASHFNLGPAVCGHVDQWPMDEIDREVLTSIAGDVLSPQLVDELLLAATQDQRQPGSSPGRRWG